MKRCPECDSFFNDAEHFCELDGTPLVAAEGASEAEISDIGTLVPRSAASRSVLPVVAVAGVTIGVLLFLIYFALTRETAPESSNPSTSNASVTQQELPLRPSQPAPVASASPSVDPSPSPSVVPSPSPQASAERIELSSNPISTAPGAKSGPVMIKLESGVTIEAEEAWQTGEGIWYRRGGVVSLLNPKDVKAIEKVPIATPQATSTPSP
jgi:hypothetical protein